MLDVVGRNWFNIPREAHCGVNVDLDRRSLELRLGQGLCDDISKLIFARDEGHL